MAAVALTILSMLAALQLRVNADLWRLLPEDYPSFQALERARDVIGGENPIDVVIEGPFADSRRLADALVPLLESRQQPDGGPFFPRVEYRRDVHFLAQHALYFATDAELDSVMSVLDGTARDARRQANPLTRRESADSTTADRIRRLREHFGAFIGTEYPIAADSATMVLRLHPASTQGDLAFVEAALRVVQGAIDEVMTGDAFPALRVRIGGRFLQERLEAQSVMDHVRRGGMIALPMVVLLVAVALGPRNPTSWIVAIPLLMSVAWTYAVAWLAFGVLNVVTTTLALVLVGMGVDYGLHFLAAYGTHRREGLDVVQALTRTYQGTAVPVAVGALTTAAALFALVAADFRAFREFGVLAGAGILLALVATMTVLPALVVLADRRGSAMVAPPVPGRVRLTPRRAVVLLVFAAGLTSFGLTRVTEVQFEYHAGALRPEFPEYQELRRAADAVHPAHGYGNPAILLADTPHDVPELVAILRSRAARPASSIGRVEALQDRVPATDEAQRARLARLQEIRALLEGPTLGRLRSPELDALADAVAIERPVALDSVPASVAGPFTTRDGTVGNVILIYPARSLSDGRNSLAFADAVGAVDLPDGRTYHAASLAIVAADMIRLMQRDSRRIMIALLAGLAGMMLLTFRDPRWAGLALLPTAVGGLWLVGLMTVMDVRLNLFNLAVLPVILGVGNDVGVHLAHGFREGAGPGLRAAVRRVAVATLTTLAGFGALTLTGHPGVTSMGVLAVLGLGVTLLAGVAVIPAVLAVAADRAR